MTPASYGATLISDAPIVRTGGKSYHFNRMDSAWRRGMTEGPGQG